MIKVYYTRSATTHVSDFNIIMVCEKIINAANNNEDFECFMDRVDVLYILSRAVHNNKLKRDNIKLYGEHEGKYVEIRLELDGSMMDSIPNSQRTKSNGSW